MIHANGFAAGVPSTCHESGPGVFSTFGELAASVETAVDAAAGTAESCWTDSKSGASILKCGEMADADHRAFTSHYNYKVIPGESPLESQRRGFRTCTPETASEILEELTLSDLAKATNDSLACNLPFLVQLKNRPNSPLAIQFKEKAAAAFFAHQDQLRDLLNKRDRASSALDRDSRKYELARGVPRLRCDRFAYARAAGRSKSKNQHA